MPNVFFKPAAERDLNEILSYIEQQNPKAAIKLIAKIEEQCFKLSQMPKIGVLRNELARGVRMFPVGNYSIYYRAIKEGVEIIRVLHGKRNIGVDFFIE